MLVALMEYNIAEQFIHAVDASTVKNYYGIATTHQQQQQQLLLLLLVTFYFLPYLHKINVVLYCLISVGPLVCPGRFCEASFVFDRHQELLAFWRLRVQSSGVLQVSLYILLL